MTTTTEPTDQPEAALAPERLGLAVARVMIQGDLSHLSTDQKVNYYLKVCQTLDLNPYTKPFDYLKLNGREILYARKDCTDQLRKKQRVSIVSLERQRMDDLMVVTATARTPDGRSDFAIGAVAIQGLKGEALANALMKAETKAKRRVTLSICGLGMTDESEIDSIPGAQVVEVPVTDETRRLAETYDRTIGAQQEGGYVPMRERDVDDRAVVAEEAF